MVKGFKVFFDDIKQLTSGFKKDLQGINNCTCEITHRRTKVYRKQMKKYSKRDNRYSEIHIIVNISQ